MNCFHSYPPGATLRATVGSPDGAGGVPHDGGRLGKVLPDCECPVYLYIMYVYICSIMYLYTIHTGI